jgi:porphobilinogen synthase
MLIRRTVTRCNMPMPLAFFPAFRPRRLRQTPWLRDLVRETWLNSADLILPLFVHPGERAEPIPTLPGVARLPLHGVIATAHKAAQLGIPAIALFPVTPPALKTPDGCEALNPDNLVCRTVRAVKAAVPNLGIICDVALDPYTTHGHDGLMDSAGRVLNDATVAVLARQAVVLAQAGADIVAPSDMMDGRVGAIRQALDAAGFQDVVILSYAAKYASAFYGPFRDAVGSKGVLQGDKRTYQMDPGNRDEALREVAQDLAEGADMVMVKPGLPYLDIIRQVKDTFPVPVLAYQVSGEYAALQFAAAAGALDGRAVMLESLLALKRAGADAILTYGALAVAEWLRDGVV